ncbi:MAG: replication protein [Actinobacteria bacterium]|nr:replication protein [Actinomycetota bacterium]
MENEDKKGCYTRIPNEVMEVLTRIKLTSYETRILLYIMRKTFGWGKNEDAISYTQFEDATGISRRHIGRALLSLEDKKIIKISRPGPVNSYSVNSNVGDWQLDAITSGGTSTCRGNTLLPHKVTELLPHKVTTKENKENLQKKRGSPLLEGQIEDIRICYSKNIKKIRIWDERRKAMIAARLKKWKADELKMAILGVARSAWHMKGGYNSLEQIFKNDLQVEKYLGMYENNREEGNDPEWL